MRNKVVKILKKHAERTKIPYQLLKREYQSLPHTKKQDYIQELNPKI